MSESKDAPKQIGTTYIFISDEKGISIVIDTNRCKGCGLCVATCPELAIDFPKMDGLFSPRGNRMPSGYPDRCIRCRRCERICPDFAIFILD